MPSMGRGDVHVTFGHREHVIYNSCSIMLMGWYLNVLNVALLADAADTIPTPRDENMQPGQSPTVAAQHIPSAREIAAARAARVRLGYEDEDSSTTNVVCSILSPCDMCAHVCQS